MAGEDTMEKRLAIAGAVIAVAALVIGAVSPALGASHQGAASTAAGHANKKGDPGDRHVHRV